MSFTEITAPQRSPEWFMARLGRLTGSRAKDAVATIKSGEAAARRDYRTQLVCERLTGQVQEDPYINADMQRGIELEPEAFAAYEALTGHVVTRSGFLAHDDHMAGCSLDGHVEDFSGIVELKCPRAANHLRTVRGGTVPTDHWPQLLHNLWVTEADWAAFVSYCPAFPAPLDVFVCEVRRDTKLIAEYERKALAFLREVEDEYGALRTVIRPSAVMKESVDATRTRPERDWRPVGEVEQPG